MSADSQFPRLGMLTVFFGVPACLLIVSYCLVGKRLHKLLWLPVGVLLAFSGGGGGGGGGHEDAG